MLLDLVLGWDVADIVAAPGVSPPTVRIAATNLHRKLDERSSFEAVIAAVCLGVLTFDEGAQETDESGRMFPGAGDHEGLQPAGVKSGLDRVVQSKPPTKSTGG